LARRFEPANLSLRLQALDLDWLGKLIDGHIARVVANLQPQVNLPRAARIVLPKILARIRQGRRDRRESPVRPVANRQRHWPAAQIRIVGLPANIELATRRSLAVSRPSQFCRWPCQIDADPNIRGVARLRSRGC